MTSPPRTPGHWRILAFGLCAGALLSALRAPRGLDWTQLPAVDGTTALICRAGALLAIALFLDARRPAFQPDWSRLGLLLGVTAGYAGHAFLLATTWQPSTRPHLGLLLLAGTVLLWSSAGRIDGGEGELPPPEPFRRRDRAGALTIGAGLAIALENLASQLRHFGLGLPGDDAVFGTLFLLLTTFGALLFGGLAANPRWRTLASPLLLTLAAAATTQGLGFLSRMQMDPLWRHLGRFSLDYSAIGTWQANAAIGGSCLVITSFLFGAGLAATRNPARLGTLLLGACLGLLLRAPVLALVTEPMRVTHTSPSWALNVALLGAGIAALGCLASVWGASRARRVFASGLLFLAFGATFAVRGTVGSFSPWFTVPLTPDYVIPTATGMVTLERLPTGTPIVTVDRKRVTPVPDELEVDARRIALAFELLPESLRAEGAVRILTIGQLTASRFESLERAGAGLVDQTAPWFDALETLQPLTVGPQDLAGDVIPPGEARRRIAAGSYDLVLAFPAHGPILSPRGARIPWGLSEEPVFSSLSVPEGTVGVAWVDAASPLVWRSFGGPVLIAFDAFRHLSLGIVRGVEQRPEGGPILLPSGSPRPRPRTWELSETPPWIRHYELQARLMERLASAAAGTELEPLTRGLAVHYRSQKPSSPFETIAQSTELEEESIQAYLEALEEGTRLDSTTRSLWEGLAELLVEKRLPDLTLAYLEVVADAFAPWPALDKAVGVAYLEVLQPDAAVSRLESALEADPLDEDTLMALVQARQDLGRPGAAIDDLRGYLERRPGVRDVRRRLAFLLDDLGEAEGRALLMELLEEDPEDEAIGRRLEIGPSFEDAE